MIIKLLKGNMFLKFCLKFLLLFSFFYFGTRAIIGLASPEGYYSVFVAQYLDYVSGLKHLIIQLVKVLLSIFGVKAIAGPEFRVGIVGGKSVIVAMSCVGYAIYSVWFAYVMASEAPLRRKCLWAVLGVIVLFLINVVRIAAFLFTYNKGKEMPLGLDHHTWFTLVAYTLIFVMIYYFDVQQNLNAKHPNGK